MMRIPERGRIKGWRGVLTVISMLSIGVCVSVCAELFIDCINVC